MGLLLNTLYGEISDLKASGDVENSPLRLQMSAESSYRAELSHRCDGNHVIEALHTSLSTDGGGGFCEL